MRLVTSFVAPALIVLAISATVLHVLQERYASVTRSAESDALISATLLEAAATARIAYSEKRRFAQEGMSFQLDARAKEKLLQRNLDLIESLTDDPGIMKTVARIRAVTADRRAQANERLIARVFTQLVEQASTFGETRRAAARAELEFLFQEVMLAVIGATLISTAFYGWMGFNLSRPLRQLLGFADAIAKGDEPPSLPSAPPRSEVGRLVNAFERMTDALSVEKLRLENLAYFDQTTRLPNRLGFLREVDRRRDEAGSRQCAILALLHFPRLSQIEALYGLEGRRRAELAIAQRLQQVLAKEFKIVEAKSEFANDVERRACEPIAGRLRFDILAAYAPMAEASMIDRLLSTFEEPVRVGALALKFSPRIAAACAPAHGQTAQALVNAAEIAGESLQRSGEAVVYRSELRDLAIKDRELEISLNDAIRSGEIQAFFQPKICCRTGEVKGAEALARWRRPNGELISPGVFIPCAERAGLVASVDYAVLRQALAQTARLRAQGHDVSVSVNLSAAAFEDPQLSERVMRELREAEFGSRHLELEVTESVAIRDLKRAREALDPLREQGVRVALDDFGTGYSSLASLGSLPIDTVKLDRSFLPRDEHDADAVAISEAVLVLAHRLRFGTVAEGIETDWQAEFVRSRGCQVMQGFLYGAPTPVAQYEELLAQSAGGAVAGKAGKTTILSR